MAQLLLLAGIWMEWHRGQDTTQYFALLKTILAFKKSIAE